MKHLREGHAQPECHGCIGQSGNNDDGADEGSRCLLTQLHTGELLSL